MQLFRRSLAADIAARLSKRAAYCIVLATTLLCSDFLSLADGMAFADGRRSGPSRSSERSREPRAAEPPSFEPRSRDPRSPTPKSDDARTESRSDGDPSRSRDVVEDKGARGTKAKASEGDDRNEPRERREDLKPPATMVEVFERLFKTETRHQPPTITEPKSPVAKSPVAKSPVVKSPVVKSPVAKSPVKTPGRTVIAPPLPPIGSKSYSATEVLAVDLTPVALERARQRGFTVGKATPVGHSTVTRLGPPPGLDIRQAIGLLKGENPTGQFEFNRLYRVYRPSNGGAAGRAARVGPAAMDGRGICDGDRCVGRRVVNWNDRLQSCSRGLRVGIIDTDVDHRHPAFGARNLKLGTFLPDGRAAAPSWHGTGVLSLLAGDPKGGTPGLIPHADFYVANIFFDDGAGDFATDTISLLKALDWMSAFEVRLINMSFTGPRDELVHKAIVRMSAKGVVFVAAAGNDGPTAPPGFPAAYKQVVAVTAINRDLRVFPYAIRGDHIDVAAPGVEILTAVPGAQEGYHTGTSFAAPYVTAIIASVLKLAPRSQKKDELLGLLPVVDLGAPGRDQIYGRGLLTAPDGCIPAAIASAPGLHRDARPPATAASASGSWDPVAIVGPLPAAMAAGRK